MNTTRSFSKSLKVFCVLVVMVMLFRQPGGVIGHASSLAVCKVDTDAIGPTHDGSTWEHAFTDLQLALGKSLCTEIWVAAGIYTPTMGTDRSATFQLKDNVALYGGFAGTETSRNQRDPSTHLTTLSGDLKGDDVGFTNNSENIFHVVTGATGAILDGFTISSGNADDQPPNNYGAGILNYASSPTITDVIISDNHATVFGGGMVNLSNSNPALTDVTFSGNTAGLPFASGLGGGLYNEDSSPALVNVTFTDNSSYGPTGRGGGLFNYSGSPTLMNVNFNNNIATHNGGGLYNMESNILLTNVTFTDNSASRNGGGMYNSSSNPTLTNITFSDNSADFYGGGMYNYSSNPQMTNITFSGNMASTYGGGMYNDSSNSLIHNTIFWGNQAGIGGAQISGGNNTSTVDYSVIKGGCPAGSTCTHVIITDPLLGILGNHGGYTQTISLQAGSSAIDAGNDLTCAPRDQNGVVRPQGKHCDIGAFEYQFIYRISLPLVIR